MNIGCDAFCVLLTISCPLRTAGVNYIKRSVGIVDARRRTVPGGTGVGGSVVGGLSLSGVKVHSLFRAHIVLAGVQ